jgi:cytochrome P450
MASAAPLTPDQLPDYEELDAPDWGTDIDALSSALFARDQGLLRSSDGSVVVYRNDDLRTLARHEAVSHEVIDDPGNWPDPDDDTALWLERMSTNNPFTLRAPEHMPKKQLGMRRVTTQSMSRFSDATAAIVDDLIAQAARVDEIDFVKQFTQPLLARFWSLALGLSHAEGARLIELVEGFFPLFRINPTQDEVISARAAGAEYMALLTGALEREMATCRHQVLRELRDDFDAMGDIGRPENPCVFFAAFALDAFHTLGSLIANVVYALVSSPEAHDRVRKDRSLVPVAFLEGSRLQPGAAVTPRQAVRDFEHAGVAIPEGTRLAMLWSCGNRDPAVFEDPSEYKLERENRSRQLTFGSGFYICPGRNVGKLLGEIVLAGITQPGVEVVPAGKPRWIGGSMDHEPLRMPMSIRRRAS